jgi:nucleoside-diphosphate-sugar epimerase
MAMPGAREVTFDPESAKERALKAVDASLALLESGQAERIIHFSTFHIYGESGLLNYNEETDPNPIHPYGEIHLLVEQRIAAHRCCKQVVVLRPTNMVGAPTHADLGDQAGLIFLDLCRQAVGGRMELRNDGKSYRDILSFTDAIEAVRLAAENPSMGGQVFNLAAGKALRLDRLAQSIATKALQPVDILYGKGVDAYREAFEVSIERMRAAGWFPNNDLTTEITETLAFFNRHRGIFDSQTI